MVEGFEKDEADGLFYFCCLVWRLGVAVWRGWIYSFLVHADAAWGGYFATMIRTKEEMYSPPIFPDEESDDADADHTSDFTSATPNYSPHQTQSGPPTQSVVYTQLKSKGGDDEERGTREERDFVPTITMREWTVRQLSALKGCDSITLGTYLPFIHLSISLALHLAYDFFPSF